MKMNTLPEKFRSPLCPYLMTGNHRILIHLDAYGVPQSFQWPRPGSPDRLGFRNFCDEWPYWEEMTPEQIRLKMPYFEYADGHREYLCDAQNAFMDYLTDTNILQGRYELPGGAVIEQTLIVPPGQDVFFRHYRISGKGKLVFQGEFFEKAKTHLTKDAVIVMYTNEIGFVKKQLRLHKEFVLLQETCLQPKNDFNLLIMGYKG